MKALYGISNSNIHTVSKLFSKYKDLKVQVLGFDDNVVPKTQILLVPTVSLFLSNRKAINKTNSVVFVFDTPSLLMYLKPIELLDATLVTSWTFNLKQLQESDIKKIVKRHTNTKEKVQVEKLTVDLIPKLLGASAPSVMKPILTFLYKIPDANKRLEYRKQVMLWFATEKMSVEDLHKTLVLLSSRKFSSLDNLIQFLQEPLSQDTKRVVLKSIKKDYTTKTFNVEKECRNTSANKYDISYILKSIRSDVTNFKDKPMKAKDVFKQQGNKGDKE